MPRGLGDDPLARQKKASRKDATGDRGPRKHRESRRANNNVFFQRRTEDDGDAPAKPTASAAPPSPTVAVEPVKEATTVTAAAAAATVGPVPESDAEPAAPSPSETHGKAEPSGLVRRFLGRFRK